MSKDKIITFGEIMMRLAAPDNLRFSQTTTYNACFGGGEVNVAVSLANFGMDAEFVSVIPKNEIGDACVTELRKYGIGIQNILRQGDRLGLYFLEVGALSRGSNVVYDRAYSAFSQIQTGTINWDEVFKDATWFHWSGITPALSQNAADVCAEAIKEANKRNITVSVDLNYRDKLWKYGKSPKDVMPQLVAGCDVVLADEWLAEKMLGMSFNPSEKTSFELFSKALIKQYPKVKTVFSTVRGSVSADHNTLSAVLYSDNASYESPTYNMTHIVDRVGGGDAFMAGIIYGLLNYKNDFQKTLNFGLATACLKHSIYGDFNLVSVAEVEKLMDGDASGRVVR